MKIVIIHGQSHKGSTYNIAHILAEKKAKELLKTFSPNLLEELEGLAKGLEMELDTIIKFYSGYDVTFPSMGCTTLINEGYYVRNYDFSGEYYFFLKWYNSQFK